MRVRLFSRRSLLGFIDGVEESLLEAAYASQTEGPKLVAFLHFSTLLLQQDFSKAFQVTSSFLDEVSRYRLLEACACYNIGIQTWSVMVLVGRQYAPKSASFTYFLF